MYRVISNLLMLLIATTICAVARGQVFGGHPPAQKWKQIKTKEARIIFPTGRDSSALRVANVIHAVSSTPGTSFGNKLDPISLVMQHHTTVPNGYVGLGPWRSEFYLTPAANSFDLGSLLWYDQLAIHEFRHVEQFSNFNVGLSKVFGILFGQQGRALANSVAVPNWFFEGDAVYNETFASTQGRGRMPYFFNGYRSLWEANKNYSWLKLRNGSLRDYVPDHYQLGYMEVAYGREKYGPEFWKTVTHDAAAFKGLFYPFQKAIKKQTGLSYSTFRNNALEYFKKPVIEKTGTISVSLPKHFNADQEYPVLTENGSLIYVKSSYKQIPSFMMVEGGVERKIRAKDVSLDHYFSYRNTRIVYASYRPDLRWGWKDYNELQILDIFTGKQKTITRKSKYFSPDIDENGKKIIAVYVDEKGQNGLHLLSAENGELVSSFPAKDKMFFTYPKFYTADQIITPVRNGRGEMGLMLVDLAKQSSTALIDFTEMVIGFPLVRNDTVYFTGSLKEKDRIFAYAIKTGQLLQLKETLQKLQTGYYQPAVNDSILGFSHFTAAGLRFEAISRKDAQWEIVSKSEIEIPAGNFDVPSLSSTHSGFLENVTDSSYSVSKYSKSHKLFNFHSLLPLIDDPNYSISVIGENVLNTLQSELFFTYNRNEQYKRLGFSTAFGGLFPYLNGGINYTIDRTALYRNNRIYWNETELRLGFRIPLTLNKGRTITGLNFGSNYVYNNPNFRGSYKDTLGNRSFGYLDNVISFNNQIQKARQHIYPRLAQTISLNYKTAIQRYEGQQFLATGSLYWPGLFINHNFIVNLAFQKRDTLQEVRFSNNFPFSRGYTAENLYTMFKWGVNYHLPLVYPDWGFGGIVYFQRIRANLFYDYTTVRDFYSNRTTFKADFRSTGTEIFFDTKWWNELPVSFGVRYSRLLDQDLFGGRGPNYFEFVLPLSLIR